MGNIVPSDKDVILPGTKVPPAKGSAAHPQSNKTAKAIDLLILPSTPVRRTQTKPIAGLSYSAFQAMSIRTQRMAE
jgi:hypothetical protein